MMSAAISRKIVSIVCSSAPGQGTPTASSAPTVRPGPVRVQSAGWQTRGQFGYMRTREDAAAQIAGFHNRLEPGPSVVLPPLCQSLTTEPVSTQLTLATA
jgi:hypothetical protein